MTIISGRAEAALGFSGVIHTIDRKDFLLFDLGGAMRGNFSCQK